MGILNLFKKKNKDRSKAETKEKTLLDILLDPNNDEDIIVYDHESEARKFSQIAVIHYQNNIYPILEPEFDMEGIGENEVIVFVVKYKDGEPILEIETDNSIGEAVFNKYLKLLDGSKK